MSAVLTLVAALLLMPAPTEAGQAAPGGAASPILQEFIYESGPYPSVHASTIAETPSKASWRRGSAARESGIPTSGSGCRGERAEAGEPVEVANGVQPDGKRHPTWNPVLFQPRAGR